MEVIQRAFLIDIRTGQVTFLWVLVFLHLTLTKCPASFLHLPSSRTPSILPSTNLASVSGTISLAQNAFSQLFLPLPVIPPFLCLAPISEDLTAHAHSSSPTLIIRSSLGKPSPTSSAKASCFLICVPRACCVFIHLFSMNHSKTRTSQVTKG